MAALTRGGPTPGACPAATRTKTYPSRPARRGISPAAQGERSLALAPGPGRTDHRRPKKSGAAAWGEFPRAALGRAIIMDALDQLAATIGVAEAWRVLGVPRSHYYRVRQ